MYNIFQARKRHPNRQPPGPRSRNNLRNAQNRVQFWINSVTASEAQLIRNGLPIHKHPSAHQFRTRNASKELSGQIYISKYVTEKERVLRSASDYSAAHLEPGKYTDNDPNRKNS